MNRVATPSGRRRARVIASLLFSGAVFAGAANAAEPDTEPAAAPGPGFSLALSLGYAFPVSSWAQQQPLSDKYSGMVPIILEAGYRLSSRVYLGGYFQYGIGNPPSCDGQCSSNDIRVGLDIRYDFLDGNAVPWIGAGIGWESANQSNTVSASTIGPYAGSTSESGLEAVNLSFGLDYRFSSHIRTGPFVTFAFAQFSQLSDSGHRGGHDLYLQREHSKSSLHQWVLIGMHSRFDL